MEKSKAKTIDTYLAELPPQKREILERVRKLILDHLPEGYEERYNWGMLSYEIPLERYPDTYNKEPLGYIAVAAQKNYFAMYLLGVYGDESRETWLREQFEKAGLKMDMGKSCLRFRKLEDLPLPALGELIGSMTPEQYIERYERVRATTKTGMKAKKKK